MKKIYLIILLLTTCIFSFAQIDFDQIDESPNDSTFYQKYLKNKLYTGGSGGLALGTLTNISLNPILGYRVSKKVRAAVGINYQYINDRYFNLSYSSYGARAFASYYFIPQLYGIAEYSLMNIEYAYRASYQRGWFPVLLAGAGYSQNLGGLSSYNIEALWNVLGSPLYPTNFPVFRVGLNIGL